METSVLNRFIKGLKGKTKLAENTSNRHSKCLIFFLLPSTIWTRKQNFKLLVILSKKSKNNTWNPSQDPNKSFD